MYLPVGQLDTGLLTDVDQDVAGFAKIGDVDGILKVILQFIFPQSVNLVVIEFSVAAKHRVFLFTFPVKVYTEIAGKTSCRGSTACSIASSETSPLAL